MSVFLLLSHVFACCVVLLAVGKSNPRTREGCDVNIDGLVNSGSNVSIHAPVRGATTANGS